MGGSRFGAISDKYKNSSESDSDDEDDPLGEGRRLGEGPTLTGSTSAVNGVAAARHQAGRGSDRVTVTSANDDDDDDDEPPAYGRSGPIQPVHDSIEDEGIDVEGSYQQLGTSKSTSLTQNWNFENLGEDNASVDFASDDAQLDSSADERGLIQFDDPDTVMTGPDGTDAISQLSATSDARDGNWERNNMIAVPSTAGGDEDSNEVAEIHLEGDKTSRAE